MELEKRVKWEEKGEMGKTNTALRSLENEFRMELSHFNMHAIWYVHEAWNSSIIAVFQVLGFVCFCFDFFLFCLSIDHILNDKGFRTMISKLDNTVLSPVELEHLPMPGPSELKQSFWFNWVLDRALATVFLKVPLDILMCGQYWGELL